MKLVLAITNYNRLNFLKECLYSWIKYRDKKFNWTLIIADDGSSIETVKFLSSIEIPETSYILLSNDRRGISHQTNQIFNHLNSIKFDLCFKIDNDMLFTKNGWEKIYINCIEKYGYEHIIYDNPKFNFITDCMLTIDWEKDNFFPTKPIIRECLIAYSTIKYAKGCFYTITPKILRNVGYMDVENFFYGLEHVDYSVRCSRAGFCDPIYAFDHKKSNEFLSYRFSSQNYKSSIEEKIQIINGNSRTNTIKKRKIIMQENRVYIPYKEFNKKMKDKLKLF